MKSQMITFPANGRNTPGYLAQPNDGRAHPGMVVIQYPGAHHAFFNDSRPQAYHAAAAADAWEKTLNWFQTYLR